VKQCINILIINTPPPAAATTHSLVVVVVVVVAAAAAAAAAGGGGYDKHHHQQQQQQQQYSTPTNHHWTRRSQQHPTCQPIIDGAALTFKCLQRSVSTPPVTKLMFLPNANQSLTTLIVVKCICEFDRQGERSTVYLHTTLQSTNHRSHPIVVKCIDGSYDVTIIIDGTASSRSLFGISAVPTNHVLTALREVSFARATAGRPSCV